MAGTLTHRFVSLLADGSQAEQIQPQRDWNDDHVFGGGVIGSLLAYDGAASDHAAWIAPAAGAGQILRSGAAGAQPAWSAWTLPATIAQGDVVVGTAANVLGVVAAVAAGRLLRAAGLSTVPAWSTFTIPDTVAQGDLLAASAANVLSPLAAVAAGRLLRAAGVGALPAWSTLTIPDTVTQGDLLHASAGNVVSALADVAVGQVLISGGVGAVPAWSASPSVTQITLGGDATMLRDLSNNVALRNGVNSQALHIYGTYTDASNYERLRIVAGGAADTSIQHQVLGTGTVRGIKILNGNVGFGIDPASTVGLAMYINASGNLLFATDNSFSIGASGATRPKDYFGSGKITSAGATAGIGYATGAGGTIGQGTSKATGVTLNTVCGAITTFASALGPAAKVSFAVSNSAVAATDNVIVAVASGGTANAYRADVTAIGGSTFTITLENITAGSLSESPVITFTVIKGVTA